MRVKVTTKFNCTDTGVTGRYKSGNIDQWNVQRNQQRNFESITQIIGLYTQLQNLTNVVHVSETNTWKFEFETEFEGIFRTGLDELGVLNDTCKGTPMMVGLGESSDVGRTLNPGQNIWFEIVE